MRRNVLAIFFLIVVFFQAGGWTSVFASGEFYENRDQSDDNYFATFTFTSEASGTLGYFGASMYYSGSLSTVDRFQLRDPIGNTGFDCYTQSDTISNFGGSGSGTAYVSSLYAGPFDGTQCDLVEGTVYQIRLETTYTQSAYWGATVEPWGTVDSSTSLPGSYIKKNNSPLTSPTASTTVTFSFDYVNTGFEGYDKAGAQIKDVTAGLDYNPIECTINLTGTATCSRSYLLKEGHGHMWRGYLRNSASSSVPYAYGPWVGLVDVVSPSASTSRIQYITGSASSTPSGFFDFLNIPYLLQTRRPFSDFYAVLDLLQNASSTTAGTAGSLTYNFSTYASGTPLASVGTVTLFSTSTVTQFLNPTVLALLRSIAVAIMYVSVAMLVFTQIKHLRL